MGLEPAWSITINLLRELLKAIRGRRPAGLKGVLVMTGDLTRERLDEIKELGADGLIEKPVDLGKLMAALEAFHALDGHSHADGKSVLT